MADSDGAWGALAEHDSERADAFDAFDALPEPGENPALDAFVERKQITHASLVRVGTRLADQHVLAFAGPRYIKFRDVVTNGRWNYADCDFSQMRVVRAGPEPSSTVIVAEGETDAARLSIAYDCDVAIMPSGARYFPDTCADQLRDYELVLVGLDVDTAGEAGSQKIIAALPQAHRFAPPANDWCNAADEDLPVLPSPEDFAPREDHVGGLVFADLASVLEDGGVPDPEVLVDDLMYTEGVHFFNGHPGSGKTTLAMHTAITAMSDGRELVWLDYEGGIRPTLRRLLACGCPVELLSKIHYAPFPGKVTEESLSLIAERWPGALVVYDSASKALQIEGLDENSAGDVTGWAVPLVKAAKLLHLPILIIDHVTKTSTRDAKYGRGAGSKQADSDVSWYVEKVNDFNREIVGTIACHQQKDREGFLPFTTWYEVGDGHGNLTLTPIDAPPEDEDGEPIVDRPGEPSI